MKKCKCGFKFAGPGEFRNCEAFVTDEGKGGVICPTCGTMYVCGKQVEVKKVSIEVEGVKPNTERCKEK